MLQQSFFKGGLGSLTRTVSAPIRSTCSHLIIWYWHFENGLCGLGIKMQFILPQSVSISRSVICPSRQPSQVFITSFLQRSENLTGREGDFSISYRHHPLKQYADKSAAALVYYFFKRLAKLFTRVLRHVVKLGVQSLGYQLIQSFPKKI